MNWTEVVAIAATVIAALGGGGVIVLGLANWIGKMFADRYVEKLKQEIQQEIESYKTRLRKSEFLFQKEFEAASEFIALRRSLMPRYRFAEMEWHDACEDFAGNFDKVERALEKYMGVHGAALNEKALDSLSVAIELAAAGKFEVRGEDVTKKGIDLADEVLNKLEEVEKYLRKVVRAQSST